jgi:gag-polyprotein putative aspartyl protease
MVPIALQGPGEILTDFALADTGADSTALPLDHAADLGIDLERDCRKEIGRTANGPGDQFVYAPGLAAQVEDIQFRVMATFMETPVIILGQEDFFRRFHAAFDHREQTLTIRAY